MGNTFEGKTIVTKDNVKIGMKVQRGRDWIYGTQDLLNGKPSVGEIILEPQYCDVTDSFWVNVLWANGLYHVYDVGDKYYDLVFASESNKSIINNL